MTTNGLSKLEQKIKEREARQAASQAASQSGSRVAPSVPGVVAPSHTTAITTQYEADAPELEYHIDPEQQALDQAIENLGIFEAYKMWCKKMVPSSGTRQKEGIKVSCPNPAHPDKNPSAWLNTAKNLYYCGGCAQGGDIWDIAAYHFGFAVPGYKKDKVEFRQLREKIGLDLGFQVVQGHLKTHMIAPVGSAVEPEPAGSEPVEPEQQVQQVASIGLLPGGAAAIAQQEEIEENNRTAPTIDWRSVIQQESFLDMWLQATTVDTCPEEYHFWTGLMALGFAAGRDVTLVDHRPVVPNMFICLTGPSGAGKSIAKEYLSNVLRDVMPYDTSNVLSRGTKVIRSPGSAEYLVTCFQAMEEDPTNPKKYLFFPVRGLVDFEELSALMGTAGRAGNNLKPQLMDIYDARKEIGTGSNTNGVKRADYPFGQALSTTQNRSLRKLLEKGDDGSGFINRWVFAQGKTKPRISRGGVQVELTDATNKLKQIHQWCFGRISIDWSDGASDLWDSFFHSTAVPTMEKAEQQGTAVLGRMDLLMKKLFLLFAINRMEKELSKESVQQAIDIWPYLLATYGIVSTEMVKTEKSDLRAEVMAQIERLTKANKVPPSKREIYHMVKRKVTDDKELIDIITNLLRLELIEEVPPPKGVRGRPTMRYQISA